MIKIRYVAVVLLLAVLFSGGAGCSKKARASGYLEKADAEFKAEKYPEAEIEYLNAIKLSPMNPIAIRQLGFIYYNQGKMPQAYAFLQKASELETNNVDVRLKLGLIHLAAQKPKEAGEAANWVLSQQPGNEDGLLLLASLPTTLKEIQDARLHIEQLRQKDSDKAAYHMAFGELFYRQRDTTNAEVEFNKALAIDSKSTAAHLALAGIYWTRNDLAKAEQEFKTAADLSPIRSPRRMKYVEFKLQTGGAADAKKSLEEIIQKAPDYVPALTGLMKLVFAEQKFDECAELVKKILAQDPGNLDAMIMSGSLSLQKGDGTNAIVSLERARAAYDSVPQIHFQLALAHLMNKDTTKASSSLTRALTLNTNYTDAIVLQAELNIRNGNNAAAVSSLIRLTQRQPQLARAHLLLASAYLSQTTPNIEAALGVYSRMAALFPKSAEVPFLSGSLLSQQKKPAEARVAFEKSLTISPDYIPAIEQLVNLDLVDKKYDAALARVKALAEKYPKEGAPQLLFAKIHLAQNQRDQAETDLKKAIELAPDEKTAYLLLTQLYVASGKQQLALDNLNSLVAKTNDVAALMQIGMIHDAMTNYPAARDAYEKLLTVNPKFTAALNNLAYLYSEKFNQLDKAYIIAEQASQLLPNDPYVADTFGWILFKRGDYTRAMAMLQTSATRLNDEPEVQFHLGMARYMMSDEQSARAAFQRAVDSPKDFSTKDVARQKLVLLNIDPKTATAANVATLEKSIQDNPGDPIALERRAAIYERDGDTAKATTTYETALKKNPNDAHIMLNLMRLYVAQKADVKKTFELAKTAHNLAPEDPAISHILSRLAFQTGDFKWAMNLVQEASLKLPDQPDLQYDLAWSQYSLGRVTDAESTLKKLLQKNATFSGADDAKRFLSMLSVVNDAAQLKAAAAQAQTILNTDPQYVPAMMVSALVQEQQSGYAAAQKIYDQVLVRFPFFAPATKQLAGLYANHLGDDKKAYELALKARESYPDDVDMGRMIGILAYKQKDYTKSAQFLKDAAAKLPNDAELMYYLGMAQYNLKDLAGSKASLQRALALNLTGDLATQANQKLTELK